MKLLQFNYSIRNITQKILLSFVLLIVLFAYTTETSHAAIFSNGFEEGDTSAYPQENIDIVEGSFLEVNSTQPRTGQYSLEISSDGTGPVTTAVIDAIPPKQNTIFVKTHISLDSSFSLEEGKNVNWLAMKNDNYRRLVYVSIDSNYRLKLTLFNPADEGYCEPEFCGLGTVLGSFGPSLPRDNSWHDVQIRYTTDQTNGTVQLWLNGTQIADLTNLNTGIPGNDDINVISWGTFFSSHDIVTKMYFDDITIDNIFVENATEGFDTEVVVNGLNIPTYATFTPDERIFIAEKDGTIRVFKNGALLPNPLVVIPNVNTYQDRGLISIALDPNFEENGYIYAAYTHDVNPADFTGPKSARVIRLTVTGDTASLASEKIILGSVVGDSIFSSCNDFPLADCMPSDSRTHTIGDMHFLPDGSLLISAGEGASDESVNDNALRSQNLDSLGGKMLRINPEDGTGYFDNPFFNGDVNANRSKVWAYGFRNPFRFTVRPSTGIIYGGDVGWGAWEEQNVIRRGENYGWPCYEGELFSPGYAAYPICVGLQINNSTTFPIYSYPHPPGAAAVGGVFYTGTTYPEEFSNLYFFGDYAKNAIWTMEVDEADELIDGSINELAIDPQGPVRLFQGPDGNIYFISIFTGELKKLVYYTNGIPPLITISASETSGPLPLTVNFSSNGTIDPDGSIATYHWDFGDGNEASIANPSHTYTIAGEYTATLTVTDSQNLTRNKSITIHAGNTQPEITIQNPQENIEASVGETVEFNATGFDEEDGDLNDSHFSWRILLHHCELTTNSCHIHPFLEGNGRNGNVVIPDHGEGTTLEIIFTATDNNGLSSTKSVIIDSEKTFLNLTSTPSGLNVVVNGEAYTTPASIEVNVNGSNSIYTPSPQIISNGTIYDFVSWSNNQTQNHTFTIQEETTINTLFIPSNSIEKTWNSYDIQIHDFDPSGHIYDTNASTSAQIEFYESANNGGIEQGISMDKFVSLPHHEGFNNVSSYWTITNPWGDYPYVGKSIIPRGLDAGEINSPLPLSVSDLQIHPPQNDHLLITTFTVPEQGMYTLSNLASRKVLPWGDTSTYKVFGPNGTEITSIIANSRSWNTSSGNFNLGILQPGDKIYFAVDRNGDYVGDATEITWTIKAISEQDAPIISTFTANPESIQTGEAVTLTWNTTNATSVQINNNVGDVDLSGTFLDYPTENTTYILTAIGPGGMSTSSATVTVTPTNTQNHRWNSYDITTQNGTPQAIVVDEIGSLSASLEFYESTNDNGVNQGSLFSTYKAQSHDQGDNHVENYWEPGTWYPYVGKSTVNRGSDTNETNAQEPLGVRDLQMHPPGNEHLTVAAFIAPQPGTYTISNLGVRRVNENPNQSVLLKVFNQNMEQIENLQSTSQAWVVTPTTYNLGHLESGEKIYFAVDRDGEYWWDFTEVSWTINYEEPEIALPTIDTFTASPSAIASGSATTLQWETSNATVVTINNTIGIVPDNGSLEVTPVQTTDYILTASNSAGTTSQEITVTVENENNSKEWNSHNIIINNSVVKASLFDTTNTTQADLILYESSNDNGVDESIILDLYKEGPHHEGFNNIGNYWTISNPWGDYPYIGKSTIGRGSDTTETLSPDPIGVFDLQFHPPSNDHMIVVAFIVPESGNYSLSNLATRRVLGWGNTATFKVFNTSKSEIASLQANGLSWTTNSEIFNLGQLQTGDKVYFAVSRDGDYIGDAVETAWTITKD